MEFPNVGPYRIEGKLGAGGMGEVYRAYDNRLERQVAIKLIGLKTRQDQAAHQRFLREARAVAGLNHPAIVQIHDIVEQEDGAAIVMEFVEGQTLTGLLANGPLPIARALRLGREIAEGLAEAHSKGVIHRDLKTDNVMVTPLDHAKILDFGLAKRISPDHQETSLTNEGQLLGTCHAMSPEQAQGFGIDHRSDLFSLGTLLYETTTGQRPFKGATAVETLSRIFTWQPPPVQTLNPEISRELSDLIEQLLQKDPNLRPPTSEVVAHTLSSFLDPSNESTHPGTQTSTHTNSAGITQEETFGFDLQAPTRTLPARQQGAKEDSQTKSSQELRRPVQQRGRNWRLWLSMLLALALAGLGAMFLRPQKVEPIYIAVPQAKVTSESNLDLVASGVRVALVRSLVNLEGVFPLSIDEVDAIEGTPKEIAHAVAADEVLTSNLDCAELPCQVTLSRIQGEDGRVLWIHSFGVPADDLLLLNNSVTQNLRAGYPKRSPRPGAPDLKVQAEDYKEYLELRQAFYQRQNNISTSRLLERLQAIEESSPRFLDAFILEARVLREQFELSHDPDDFDRALLATKKAHQLSPEDPQVLSNLFLLELAADHFEEAEEVLAERDRLQPGETTVLAHRALLKFKQGQIEDAREWMQTAVQRHPSRENLFNLSTMEYRQGDLESTRSHLREILERTPNHYRTLSFLAEVELLAGNPEAVSLYQNLVKIKADGVREVWNLGSAYLLMGRYEEAASSYHRALELEPRAWRISFSLAEAKLLLGEHEEAEKLFRQVLEHSSQSTEPSGMTLVMQAQSYAALGERQQAAAALQEALKKDSDRPFFAYQAALVYTMIGESSSALARAEKALQQGLGPRWFELPLFDPLRTNPDFQALFSEPQAPFD